MAKTVSLAIEALNRQSGLAQSHRRRRPRQLEQQDRSEGTEQQQLGLGACNNWPWNRADSTNRTHDAAGLHTDSADDNDEQAPLDDSEAEIVEHMRRIYHRMSMKEIEIQRKALLAETGSPQREKLRERGGGGCGDGGGHDDNRHPSYAAVPIFFRKEQALGSETYSLRLKLRDEAKARFLQKKEDELMEFDDLTRLEQALQTHRKARNTSNSGGGGGDAIAAGGRSGAEAQPSNNSSNNDSSSRSISAGGGKGKSDYLRADEEDEELAEEEEDGEGDIDYDAFMQIKKEVSSKTQKYFTAKIFVDFPKDEQGCINGMHFFKQVYGSICLQKTRITLHYYDTVGKGYLREQDLENYVYDLIPTMPTLHSMHDNFYPFYVFTAVRRFMFFLDIKRKGRVDIDLLVKSRIMDELLELGMAGTSDDDNDDGTTGSGGLDGNAGGGAGGGAAAELADNWFSAENALRVYSEYLSLDADQNGMLSSKELLGYAGSRTPMRLTPVFVQRLFEEIITYRLQGEGAGTGEEGEMDYKTYLDFVLAMENMKTPQSLMYFWRLLDVQHCGYITNWTVNYFFRDIVQHLQAAQCEAPNVTDVTDEIFDMVKPRDPLRITLRDVLDSSVGHTVVSMLIDINGFWAYDNRENIMQDGEEGESEGAVGSGNSSSSGSSSSSSGGGGGNGGGGRALSPISGGGSNSSTGAAGANSAP